MDLGSYISAYNTAHIHTTVSMLTFTWQFLSMQFFISFALIIRDSLDARVLYNQDVY